MSKTFKESDRENCFSADLCHRWRDVHSCRHHWLLYIHRFRSLEEDPDRKNVLRTTPQPVSHLIYKFKVPSLLVKSNPARTSFLEDDQWSGSSTRSNYQARWLHLCYWSSSQCSICSDDVWTLTITCPLPPSSVSGEEREAVVLLWRWNLKYCVSGYNQYRYLKAAADIFRMK